MTVTTRCVHGRAGAVERALAESFDDESSSCICRAWRRRLAGAGLTVPVTTGAATPSPSRWASTRDGSGAMTATASAITETKIDALARRSARSQLGAFTIRDGALRYSPWTAHALRRRRLRHHGAIASPIDEFNALRRALRRSNMEALTFPEYPGANDLPMCKSCVQLEEAVASSDWRWSAAVRASGLRADAHDGLGPAHR